VAMGGGQCEIAVQKSEYIGMSVFDRLSGEHGVVRV
jgi:hypothetical protein